MSNYLFEFEFNIAKLISALFINANDVGIIIFIEIWEFKFIAHVPYLKFCKF